MMKSIESLTYQYVCLMVHWGSEEKFRLRLYDTERRVCERLAGIYQEPQPIALKRLREIKKIVNEEIKKLKNK
jgi:hypothetical protein